MIIIIMLILQDNSYGAVVVLYLRGVSQSNGVISIFARPTLVAMVTKISKIQQKIGCV